MTLWLTLGLRPPGDAATEIQRLRFVRDLSVRSLVVFGPTMLVLFVLFMVPLWGFGVLVAALLLQAVSILRLTQRIRRLES